MRYIPQNMSFKHNNVIIIEAIMSWEKTPMSDTTSQIFVLSLNCVQLSSSFDFIHMDPLAIRNTHPTTYSFITEQKKIGFLMLWWTFLPHSSDAVFRNSSNAISFFFWVEKNCSFLCEVDENIDKNNQVFRLCYVVLLGYSVKSIAWTNVLAKFTQFKWNTN